MVATRSTIRYMSIVFVIALLIGQFFQTQTYAEVQENKATILVIGKDNDVLTETSLNIDEKVTALDVLSKTVGINNIEVSESTYGKMISSINGVKAKDTYYWAFYINGISSQIGADSYFVQKGDQLCFRYVDWTVAPEKTVSVNVTGTEGLMKEATNIDYKGEPTALQLLQSVFGEKVKYTESQYGKMITSIDGLEAKGSNYWAFYVNGQMGTVGADSYKLKAGDQISFKYESWESPGNDSEDDTKGEETIPSTAVVSAEKVQKAVDQASQYVLKNEVGEWEVIALKQAKKKLPENYLTELTKQVKEKQGRFSKITDYERYTLGILAAGGNPTNVAGYNLVEAIYNGNIEKQGLNGVFYGLIALDSANFEIPKSAKWSREKLVNNLLAKQNQDGGWSWDGGAKSDIDTTAMVLTALAPYKSDKKVNSSIDVAVKYLSQQYLTGKIDNSSTAAQVVIGLTSIGIDANNKLFINAGTSLINYLLTYQNADGGFDWQGGNESDVFSTSQAFQAIVALQLSQNGKGLLYNLPLTLTTNKPVVDNNKGQKETDRSIIIENQEGKPLPNTATNTYNFLTVGLVLMLFGAILFLIEKRRKA